MSEHEKNPSEVPSFPDLPKDHPGAGRRRSGQEGPALYASGQSGAQAPSAAALPPLLIDLKSAADMLGLHINTIRREINRGNLASVRIGRVLRIRVAELQAYVKRNETRRPASME